VTPNEHSRKCYRTCNIFKELRNDKIRLLRILIHQFGSKRSKNIEFQHIKGSSPKSLGRKYRIVMTYQGPYRDKKPRSGPGINLGLKPKMMRSGIDLGLD
jgi:hypothetical protein